MAKKYLVVEKVPQWGEEEVVLIPLFFSKEEIIKRYVGFFVETNTDKWVRVKDEEEGYELLMFCSEVCSITAYIKRHGIEGYEEWRKEVKDEIFCGMCPSIKVYEILEHGVFEVDNLKFIKDL